MLSYYSNVWYLTREGFVNRNYAYAPMSTLQAPKSMLKKAITAKLGQTAPLKWAEPGVEDEFSARTLFKNSHLGLPPVIDIRHGENFTGARDNGTLYPEVPGWGTSYELWAAIDSYAESHTKAADPDQPSADAPSSTSEYLGGQSLDYSKVSLIITAKCEKLLCWTVENLIRTAPGAEIIVVYDGWQTAAALPKSVRCFMPWAIPLGVGPCRDYGIEHAKGEFVVCLDAHMDFEDRWLDKLLAPVRENPKAISCSRSAVLRHDRLDMTNAEKINTGAIMQWNNEKNMPFEPKWQAI
jgi:hypothetical protein